MFCFGLTAMQSIYFMVYYCFHIVFFLAHMHAWSLAVHTMTNQLANTLLLWRLDYLYCINCRMMRKMKTNFCLITVQTNSPSISSYIGLMWWIHFIASQHLLASIPITSHLLVMNSRVRATSAAQGDINCLVRNTYHNICTHGYQLCMYRRRLNTGTWASSKSKFCTWCLLTFSKVC